MRAALVGQMVASTQGLGKLKEELEKRGFSVDAFFANGKNFQNSLEEIKEAVKNCNVLVTGMASSEYLAKEELMACEVAAEARIPLGFYADTFGAHNRPWFEYLRERASFVFVVNAKEAEEAMELFPNAKIVASGNPMWETYFFPKADRNEVRKKLSVDENQTMILCPGGKNVAVNTLHWGGVIEALSREMEDNYQHWKIVLSMHPGDTPDKEMLDEIAAEINDAVRPGNDGHCVKMVARILSNNRRKLYEDLIKYSKVPVVLVPASEMSGSEMIPAADLIIESASGVGNEAVCQGKPMITYFSEIARNRHEEQTKRCHSELCMLGASTEVFGDASDLYNEIQNLLYYGGAKTLIEKQAELFQEPAHPGVAVNMMAETLLEAVNSINKPQ